MRVVAISGSLRAGSSNTTILQEMKRLAPSDLDVDLWEGLGDLPHFNPDLDEEDSDAPRAVAKFRELLRAADGILISTPEYAHGLPGSLKNALDWLVSDGLLVAKRVLLVNASPRSTFAQAQLIETLRTMSWNVVASVTLQQTGRTETLKGAIDDFARLLRDNPQR